MATLEELEQRVADLEQYVEEQATHTLAYSAEQVDAFFATVDARVLSGGRKTVVLTNEARFKDVALSAEDLGVTNVTSDIKVVHGSRTGLHHRRRLSLRFHDRCTRTCRQSG